MKLLKTTISLVHPEGVFLVSKANEGKTETSFWDMGLNLSKEVQNFIE